MAAALDHPDHQVDHDGRDDHDQEELAHGPSVVCRTTTLEGVKEFLVYTAMRIGLFVGSLAVVIGAWSLVAGDDGVPALWAVVIALLLSGVASYFLLNRQRAAFAARVQERADRASAAFEARKAREDAD